MDNITLVNQIEEPKSSFAVESNTVTLKSPEKPTKQTSLEVIKNLAISLGGTQQDSEVQYIQDSFKAITGSTNRKEFEVAKDTDELAKSYYGRTEYKEPGSLASSTFSIDATDETSEATKSFSSAERTTVDHVKDTSYGTIAQTVNFDVMDELKTQMYHAKFALEKVTGVKEQATEDLNKSMDRVREVLDVERKELVIKYLKETLQQLHEVPHHTLNPDERDGLNSAIYNINCALVIVNKAGFKSQECESNDQVKNYVSIALKLWPKLKEDAKLNILLNQILIIE